MRAIGNGTGVIASSFPMAERTRKRRGFRANLQAVVVEGGELVPKVTGGREARGAGAGHRRGPPKADSGDRIRTLLARGEARKPADSMLNTEAGEGCCVPLQIPPDAGASTECPPSEPRSPSPLRRPDGGCHPSLGEFRFGRDYRAPGTCDSGQRHWNGQWPSRTVATRCSSKASFTTPIATESVKR